MRNLIIIILGAVALLGGGVWMSHTADNSEGDLISRSGIHWHAALEIYVHGKKIDIPAGIGLVGGHNPMHTHDPDGVIHLEYDSVVHEDDIRLGEFFKLWGKKFSSEQLFEYENSEEGAVRMFVNGEENTGFENYLLQDNDVIEIRYEA